MLNATGVRLPAFKFYVDRLGFRQYFKISWKIFQQFAIVPVIGTNFYLIKIIKNIKFGNDNLINTAHLTGIADNYGVKPSATPRPPGGGPKFPAFIANFISKFGRKFSR